MSLPPQAGIVAALTTLLVAGALASSSPAANRSTWRKIRKQAAGIPCDAGAVDQAGTSKNLKMLAKQALPPEIRTGELDGGGFDVVVFGCITPGVEAFSSSG